MAFLPVGNEGSLNGTTAVDVVAAPASAHQIVVANIKFSNVDTAAVTIILYKYKTATLYEIARETLQVGDYWSFSDRIVCDATDEKVQAKMSGAAATTNPTFESASADVS